MTSATLRGRDIADAVEAAAQVAVGEDPGDAAVRRRRPPSCPCPCGSSRRSRRRAWRRAQPGNAAPVRITSVTRVSRRRPSAPPGCERAKSSAEKPRASSSASASASPSASAAVVLAVGARPSGHASTSTAASRCTSAACASELCSLPVSAMSRAPSRFRCGVSATSSSVSPEFDSMTTMSSAVIMPRSPCDASAGCTKNAGVPVDAKVAASLRPMWPDLPMPETTMRPRQLRIKSTRGHERRAEARRQRGDRAGLGGEHIAGERQRARRIDGERSRPRRAGRFARSSGKYSFLPQSGGRQHGRSPFRRGTQCHSDPGGRTHRPAGTRRVGRSSTQDFAGRATRDGRRDLRDRNGTESRDYASRRCNVEGGAGHPGRANVPPSAQCVRRVAGSRVLTARHAAKHAHDDMGAAR